MRIRLFALLILLSLGTAVPALAEITFGLAVVNPLIRTEPLALRFDAYLEKRLGEPVVIQVVADEQELRQWVKVHRQVDFALFSEAFLRGQPTGEFIRLAELEQAGGASAGAFVGDPAASAATLEKLGRVLRGMDDDPDGVRLLGEFGVARFAVPRGTAVAAAAAPPAAARPAPAAARPRPTPRPSAAPPAPRPAARPAPATQRPAAAAALSLGIARSVPPVGSEAEARRLADYLQQHLGEPVKVRVLPDEQTLYDWVGIYRELDLALLSTNYLNRRQIVRLYPLADVHGPQAAGEPLSRVVTSEAKPAAFKTRVQKALLDMPHSAGGSGVLSALGIGRFAEPSPTAAVVTAKAPAAPAARPSAPSRPVSAAAQPARRPSPAAKTAAKPAAKPAQTTLGVATSDPLFGREAQARRLAGLLGEQLGEPVAVRMFASDKVLFDWVSLYREVDLAVLEEDFVRRQPIGKVFPLAGLTPAAKSTPARLVVSGPAPRPGYLEKTQKALLGLDDQPAGRQLLADAGVSKLAPPVAAPAKPTPARVAASAPREVRRPAAPAPVRSAAAPTRSARPAATQAAAPQAVTLPKLAVPPPMPYPPVAAAPAAPTPTRTAAAPAAQPAPAVPARVSAPQPPLLSAVGEALPPQGIRAEMDGRWEDAILVYQRALQSEPGRTELWRRVADIQAMLGRPHEAALSLLWALSQAPQEVPIYLQLAQAHSVNGQLQAAVSALRRALDLDPDDPGILRAQGQIAAWGGDLHLARESYLKILSRAWRDVANRVAGE
ncbi:hypothetical protein DESUT3_37930 [Desulfuromonas versatilis]|uniref:Tetratricopeptide repeat protein n=1 Tax=Desulfuromonas versatilis TaxID=2802975 RepID=A0ABM8I040_9BACT|nr:tetratricopeptide repeat protein [Desulfuromonas versatilis]BCR06724.1 hypothetical protein DESUT3_37930 [Desulfuromonas versatilis]